MKMNPAFFFVEAAAVILFAFGASESRKKGSGRLLEFLMIFYYGLLLEELDMRIFKTYHYGTGFLLWMGHVPIAIALLWAVILASSMAISDHLGLPEFFRPFADALFAVWIDLALDAIAIRIGYWQWGISLNDGWFGVPAGNLYAWMWVAFWYSALARFIRRRLPKSQNWKGGYFVLPFFAYAGLFVSMNSLGMLGRALGLISQSQRLYLFWTQFVIFLIFVLVGLSKRKQAEEKVAAVWWRGRFSIHLYFLLAFFIFGIFRSAPWLGVISAVALGGEFWLHRKTNKAFFICLLLLTVTVLPAWAGEDSKHPDDWYARAKEDLAVAELLLQGTPYYGPVCFHSHQAVEKSLKAALLIYGGVPDQTHSASHLLAKLVRFRPEFSRFESGVHSLDPVYVPSRYPQAEAKAFTRGQAAECLREAKEISEALTPVHTLAAAV